MHRAPQGSSFETCHQPYGPTGVGAAAGSVCGLSGGAPGCGLRAAEVGGGRRGLGGGLRGGEGGGGATWYPALCIGLGQQGAEAAKASRFRLPHKAAPS